MTINNFSIVRSFLLNKTFLTKLEIKDIVITRDEFQYELNLFLFIDYIKWSDFFKHISNDKVSFKIKSINTNDSNKLLIYDKNANFYKENYNKVLHALNWFVVDYFTELFDYEQNYLIKFSNISKIILVSLNNNNMDCKKDCKDFIEYYKSYDLKQIEIEDNNLINAN